MGFPRQENWSGWPFPSPGDLPNSGKEPSSPTLAGGFFTTEPPLKPQGHITEGFKCQSTATLNAEGSWEVGRGSTTDFSLEMGGEKS